jgi:2-polyprenyl-6-methoxyphenol hydroxylase-like FAD-dependent oxidoreductase
LQVRVWPDSAAQAIEDGVVLAEELGASGPDEVEDAFTRYAARR